ncbi:CHAD domain-containing protein [Phytoactinopolyspora endophytica]|uniref:CHAD domain-containing protein n=1 Tax=Phytoactinopolyspora endophytica TaxID=1642495 RepID=UPI00101D6C5F|nr:CHAD domain-containing protein [Phytoactinopolyspora endophytica]
MITAGLPANVAIATAQLGFLDAIEGNVAGTLDGADPEYLHELRVGVRRTRSLIKLTGDVLPSGVAAHFAPRFKWLGDLTTPTRDLDVYLIEMDQLAEVLVGAHPEDLAPFTEHLRRQRAVSRRTLVAGLRCERFTDLCTSWRAMLTEITEGRSDGVGQAPAAGGDTPATVTTVEQLGADRVRRVYARVLRRAQAITSDSPAEKVHALRKRCKELRYILEVFQPVCAEHTHRSVIKRLKRLQDVLGAFQDGEVQSEGLRTFAQQMLDDGPPPAATLLAMGELSAHFTVQQRQARHELTAALPRFLGATTHERIESMLP